MKFEYIVVYENILDKFDIGSEQGQGHGGTLKFYSIYHNTNDNSTLIEAGKLISSTYIHLIIIHNNYEYRHA